MIIGASVSGIRLGWRFCFWVATIPAGILALAIVFCPESPHWMYKQGRSVEAEIEFERLLRGAHVKYSMAELSKLDRGDDTETVKLEELFHGRHFRVCDGTFFPSLLNEMSGVIGCFNERAQKLLEIHLASGFSKCFIWFKGKIQGTHVALIQEGRDLVNYALINATAIRKILKKYDKARSGLQVTSSKYAH